MKVILSIDGGGIKGVIPGMILVNLEERIKKKTKNPEASITEYFDFFAGTSTGGILISLILCPSATDPTKPRFSAKDALNLYLKHGSEIFEAKGIKKMFAKFGWVTEKYSSANWEKILKDYFGDIKLSQLIKPCIITAYNIELRKAHFFRQIAAVNRGDSRDFLVRDVCRATSAAPTYFSVAEINSLSGVRYPLLDGGMFATNPTLSAFVEVKRDPDEVITNDVYILSLGTGSSKKSYDSDEIRQTKALFVVPALLDMMMSGASEISHFYMMQIFKFLGISQQYVRLEPKNLQSIDEDLDAASPKNIKKLVSLGDRLISERNLVLDRIADKLIELRTKEEKLKI